MASPYPVDIDNISGLRRIRLSGRVDSLSASAVQGALMALVDEGERRMLVDLSAVDFLSSAGMRVLIIVQKQLHGSSGELILFGAQAPVRDVLETVGLTRIFTLVDDASGLAAVASGRGDAEEGTAIRSNGIALRLLTREGECGQLRIIGDHRPLARAAYREEHLVSEPTQAGLYAVGLGAAGGRFADYAQFFGESLVMDGNFFVQPAVPNPRVDYVLREWSGSMGELHFLHAFAFSGPFRHLVQFEGRERPIDLERLRSSLFEISEADLLGVVLLAESRGHWGMALRRSPLAGTLGEAEASIFDAGRFADWLDFPVEPGEPGLLLAVTGLVARERGRLPPAVAELFPEHGNLHLHALVLQRGHLSRRAADFERELQRVLANQLPQQVCHLLPATTLRAGLLGLIELEV